MDYSRRRSKNTSFTLDDLFGTGVQVKKVQKGRRRVTKKSTSSKSSASNKSAKAKSHSSGAMSIASSKHASSKHASSKHASSKKAQATKKRGRSSRKNISSSSIKQPLKRVKSARLFTDKVMSSFFSTETEYIYNAQQLIDLGLKEHFDYDTKKGKQMAEYLVDNACSNSIQLDYKKDVMKAVYKSFHDPSSDFDIAINTSAPLEQADSHFAQKIIGFLVSQKGECTALPEAHSILLICSSSSGGGSLLLALFLFAIMTNPAVTNKVGLLELATSYQNLKGLCSYSKFGFKYSPDLYTKIITAQNGTKRTQNGKAKCFTEIFNLPMMCNTTAEFDSPDVIRQILRRIDVPKGMINARKHPLCTLSIDEQAQMFLAMAYTVMMAADTDELDKLPTDKWEVGDGAVRYAPLIELYNVKRGVFLDMVQNYSNYADEIKLVAAWTQVKHKTDRFNPFRISSLKRIRMK
jgi:hypothetical protein